MSLLRRDSSDSKSNFLPKASVEETLISKLRSRISDVIQEDETFAEDFYLLHWLKARKMKLDATESAIRSSFKWRKENHLKPLSLEDLPKETLKMLPMYGNAVDKNGVPVLQIATGVWDTKGYIEKYGRDAFVHVMSESLMCAEKLMMDYNRKLNRKQSHTTSEGVSMIVNCAGYTWKQFSYLPATMAALESVQIYDRHFPKYVHKIFFINVNKVALPVTKMVLPFLGIPDIEIYGCNQESWQPKLLERIDPDQLLQGFGGTRILNTD